jgi:hypothetical protein
MRYAPLLLIAIAACVDPGFSGPPELVLGFGADELEEIEDGAVVPIARGPQGGTVLWGAASVRNMEPRDLRLVFTITSPAGEQSLRRVVVDLDEPDGGVTLGHLVFLPDPGLFTDLPCQWRAEAIDREGRIAIDEKMVVPTATR